MFLMGETRAGKYGRFEAAVLNYIIITLPSSERETYLSRFLREFEKYSDVPRKKGEPRNEGCVHELEGLECLDVLNPEQLARWFKEGQHLKYQKDTVRRERASFLENL
jgi:hypothetical protein